VDERACRYWVSGEKSPGRLALKSLVQFERSLSRAGKTERNLNVNVKTGSTQ
jgi:hypothetical protein